MCTLTLVRGDGRRVRVVCSRDEQRSRSAALPPSRHERAGRVCVMPIDPVSRGSWIGVNDAGLIGALLNANPAEASSTGARSRGELVPQLLGLTSVEESLRFCSGIDGSLYAPFTLLVAALDDGAVLSSDGRTLRVVARRAPDAPLMLTSSGLGDHLVEPCRRALFRELFDRSGDPLDAQHAFHAHRWKDRPHLSVLMSRADARTVSRTTVDLLDDEATVTYTPLDDAGAPQASHTVSLALAHARTTP